MLGETVMTRSEGKHYFKKVGSDPLSNRQHEVLTLMAQGFRLSKIAQLMSISPKTVDTHIVHTLEKLSAENRTQAVLTAISRGIIPLEEVVADFDFSRFEALSPAESRVRRVLIDSEYDKVDYLEIASRLCVTVRTIEVHLSRIYRKLDFDTKTTSALRRLSVLSLIEEQRQSLPTPGVG